MDEYIGFIKLSAVAWEPKGYMFCDGRTLNVNNYQTLAAALGNDYENQKEFTLPNLSSPEGVKYVICVEGLFPPKY